MLSQMCLIDSKALPVILQEWLSFTDATCRPLYPCRLLRFLPLTCMWSWATLPLQSSGAPGLVSSQTDCSPVTRSPFFSFLLPSTAALLNSWVSSLQGDSHRYGGNARVTDTQTDQQMETTGVPSHSPPAGGSSRESYHQNTAAEQEGCGKAKARGHSEHHLLFISLFLFLFSGWNSARTPTCAQQLSRWPLIYAYAHSYYAIIRQCKPVVNNCLFSPRRCWFRIRRRR